MSYSATFKKLDDGTWAIKTDGRCGYPSINHLKTGCVVGVSRKNGNVSYVELCDKIDTDNDCINIWSFRNTDSRPIYS